MIITLCGSRRYAPLYDIWNQALTYEGHCVFSICSFPSLKDGKIKAENFIVPNAKERFDAAHMAKIKLSNGIVVLNAHGYIGDTTRVEIMFAKQWGVRCFAIDYRAKEQLVFENAYELIPPNLGKLCKKIQASISPL